MSRIKKASISGSVLALCMVLGATVLVSTAWADPPDPQPLPPTGNCYRDNIFYGAVPPGGENAPVIVFVHGYGGLAIDWWLRVPPYFDNDSYVRAYEAGYRTAFVNMNVDPAAPNCSVARTPSQSVIYDGFVLGLQIEVISQYYGADQVDIVAHSKGGIDAQAAILWFGAANRVRNVFTLSSPHQGSLLADLLWSPEGSWLGWLLGRRDAGTFSIQTGPMQLFRAIADASTADDGISYYSAAGNDYSADGPGLQWTGAYLEPQPTGGPNDGAVTVNSTYLPYASVLFQEPWDHLQMFMGRNAFPYILAVLRGTQAPARAQAAPAGLPDALPLSTMVRGGPLDGVARVTIPVEPQAQAVRFALFTSQKDARAALVDPAGTAHDFQAVPAAAHGLPEMPPLQQATVEHPTPGQWRLRISGQGGYLLLVMLDSTLSVELQGIPDRLLAPGETLYLSARSAAGQPGVQRLAVRLSNRTGSVSGTAAAGAQLAVPISQQPGFYGMSVSVSGQTNGGLPFERTFVRSVGVVDGADLAGGSGLLNALLQP
jgi:hypothetical protein